ncbi:hypothetical protein M758_4G047800 [Ceratodon purpureus]|nr:hypothetical protein M758_4G047800 [Ceratodon purpureus]
MSLCRLYSIHAVGAGGPVNWRWVPGGRSSGGWITRASGGRSTSRRERSRSSRPEDDGEEGDGAGVSSLWDSNVENVRRRNRNRSDGREAASQTTSTPDWLTPKKDWTFNSEENRSEGKWDKPDEERPWWKSSKVDEEYDDEEEEEGEGGEESDEEDDDDSDQLFSSLRWGIPVSFVVLPWLLGNPVILLLGLAAVPAVQKAVGPVVSEVWQALLNLSGSSSPKRRRRANTYDSNSDEGEDAYASWGGERDDGQPYRYKRPASGESDDKYPAEAFPYSDVGINRPASTEGGQQSRKAGQSVSMGGWEDLEAEKRGRMPVRRTKKPSKLGWRSKRKEKPLFVRLLVALFPFLRNWGGWLSIFLLFPYLGGSLEGNLFTYFVS